MTELDEYVLEEAGHQGETLVITDLVSLVERHHPLDAPGAPVDLLEAYVAELAETDARFEPENVREAVEERLVDSETWVDADALYPLGDDRVSNYPLRWHEQLGGESDVRRYIEVILDNLPAEGEETFDTGGAGTGIPKLQLLEIVEVLGGLSQGEVRRQLDELEDEGAIAGDVREYPNARIELT